MKRIISVILIIALTVAVFTGCENNSEDLITNIAPTGQKATAKPYETDKVDSSAEDLMADILPNNIRETAGSDKSISAADFAVRLFKASNEEGKNTLISPLSVLCALAMTANGAEGETLSQMENVLGMSIDDLNKFIYNYVKNLPQDEKYKLSLANSIWFNEDDFFTANQDFLQTNADYYGADIYEAAFNNSALNDINEWVNKNTDEMIPEILDEINADAVMYLINALAFDAEWRSIYAENQVRNHSFTCEDGTEKEVEFMYGEEYKYLEDSSSTGFIKYYKDRSYAFAAILPNEGVTVSEYVESLTGQHLRELLSNPSSETVYTSIPKFETEYSIEMSNILRQMGIVNAFDAENADFTNLGASQDGNIFINRVMHKTYISVDEKGTRAGAATAIEMKEAGAPLEPKKVYLDRPFVYMLIDCESNLPFFIGTMMDVG